MHFFVSFFFKKLSYRVYIYVYSKVYYFWVKCPEFDDFSCIHTLVTTTQIKIHSLLVPASQGWFLRPLPSLYSATQRWPLCSHLHYWLPACCWTSYQEHSCVWPLWGLSMLLQVPVVYCWLLWTIPSNDYITVYLSILLMSSFFFSFWSLCIKHSE